MLLKSKNSSAAEKKKNDYARINKLQCKKTNLRGFLPGPEVIKLFSCSALLRLKFILLINVKMPTIVGILTFMSRINYRFCHSKSSISIYLDYFSIYFYEELKF